MFKIFFILWNKNLQGGCLKVNLKVHVNGIM